MRGSNVVLITVKLQISLFTFTFFDHQSTAEMNFHNESDKHVNETREEFLRCTGECYNLHVYLYRRSSVNLVATLLLIASIVFPICATILQNPEDDFSKDQMYKRVPSLLSEALSSPTSWVASLWVVTSEGTHTAAGLWAWGLLASEGTRAVPESEDDAWWKLEWESIELPQAQHLKD